MNDVIGIVTVLYNGATVLEEYFASLNIQTYKNFVLYVIDNDSTDNSLQLAKKLAESAHFQTFFIENKENVGVAEGNNIGIKQALIDCCEFVLLSNNDIAFPKDAIKELLDGMETNNADMVVPKIYFYGTDLIWAAGGSFNKFTGKNLHTGELQKDSGQFQVAREVSYSPTCFMLIRKEVFNVVGLMDSTYFVYYDDTDFVYRALKMNIKLWYIPESIVYHNVSTSTGYMSPFSIRYLNRNMVYFALKNYSLCYALYVICLDFSYNFFVLFFKWPFSKWFLRVKSYREGYLLYKNRKHQ